jgi:segregation and condensation protein A
VVGRDYTVHLERVFQGPLDLLLHLVREQEVEIHEIEISKVTRGYLAYLESLDELDIEIAGDFLVMAATLMAIKSRSLLPTEEVDLAAEIDPRDELIQRLIEYRRFRATADDLGDRFQERGHMAGRGWHEDPGPVERSFELGELTSWDLLSTYSRLMRETLADRPHHVATDPRPLRFYVDHLVEVLRRGSEFSLTSLIDSLGRVPQREAVVGSFCALLELVRMQVVEVRQDEGERDIAIAVRPEHSADFEAFVKKSLDDEDAEQAVEAPISELTPESEG